MSTYRHKRKMFHKSRSSLVWFLIISLVAVIIAAVLGLGGGLINFIDEHANVLDTQYIPVDLERRTADALKKELKDIDKDKLEQIKKKFLEKSSKK